MFQCGWRQRRHSDRPREPSEPKWEQLASITNKNLLFRTPPTHDIHHYRQDLLPVHTKQPTQNDTRRPHIHNYQRSLKNLPQADAVHQTL